MEKVLNRLNELADDIIYCGGRLSNIHMKEVQEYNRLVDMIEKVTNGLELLTHEEKIEFLRIKYDLLFLEDDFNIEDMNDFREECKLYGVNPLEVVLLLS